MPVLSWFLQPYLVSLLPWNLSQLAFITRLFLRDVSLREIFLHQMFLRAESLPKAF